MEHSKIKEIFFYIFCQIVNVFTKIYVQYVQYAISVCMCTVCCVRLFLNSYFYSSICRHILMHLDIAAVEVLSYKPEDYFRHRLKRARVDLTTLHRQHDQ